MSARIRNLERLMISSMDFEEALSYVQQLKELRDTNSVVLKALTMMAVIAYCRPFTKNHGPSKNKISEKDFLKNIEVDHAKYHETLMSFRNDIFAHSSSKEKKVQVEIKPEFSSYGYNINPNYTWNKVDIEKLEKIIEAGISYCSLTMYSESRA